MAEVDHKGLAYKADRFQTFISSRPELAHVRTKRRSPETNGVVERFYGSLKYEHLYRLEIPNGHALADELELYRALFNEIPPAREPPLPDAARGLPDPP